MKYSHRLFIRGATFVALAGLIPATAQDVAKDPAAKPQAAATSAQRPAVIGWTDKPELTVAQKRTEIDKAAKAAHATLFAKSPEAKKLYDQAYGCAIFDNVNLAPLLTGGGKGVAMAKATPDAGTYMTMGPADAAHAASAPKHQVVFLFETKERFDKFVKEGWQADHSAKAAAAKPSAANPSEATSSASKASEAQPSDGKPGVKAPAGDPAEAQADALTKAKDATQEKVQGGFKNGVAAYQISDAGQVTQADLAGMKFWRDDELNAKHEQTD